MNRRVPGWSQEAPDPGNALCRCAGCLLLLLSPQPGSQPEGRRLAGLRDKALRVSLCLPHLESQHSVTQLLRPPSVDPRTPVTSRGSLLAAGRQNCSLKVTEEWPGKLGAQPKLWPEERFSWAVSQRISTTQPGASADPRRSPNSPKSRLHSRLSAAVQGGAGRLGICHTPCRSIESLHSQCVSHVRTCWLAGWQGAAVPMAGASGGRTHLDLSSSSAISPAG